MRSRQMDQRRYRFEEVTGQKPDWMERSLLQRYTVNEVIALRRARREIGEIEDITRYMGGK